jgi:hypothetical protein
VTTDDAAIQEQHRHIEAVPALQNGVAVDVDHFDGRKRSRASQRMQLAQHLVAQLTVVAMDDRQARRQIAQWWGPLPTPAWTELAMKRTVCGGTSPTAVTLWPSITVENADEEPTLADSSTGESFGEVLGC